MKKLLLGALLVVGISAAYASDVAAGVMDLDAAYQALKEEEARIIAERKDAAEAAQQSIDEQRRVYAELAVREARVKDEKKWKFYKKEYSDLAKQYRSMRKELESSIAEQQAIVDEYNMLVSGN